MQTGRLRRLKRSRTGCPECRRRKIKCDEQKPKCGQCRKGNRTCRLQDSLFKRYSCPASSSTSDHAPQEDDDPEGETVGVAEADITSLDGSRDPSIIHHDRIGDSNPSQDTPETPGIPEGSIIAPPLIAHSISSPPFTHPGSHHGTPEQANSTSPLVDQSILGNGEPHDLFSHAGNSSVLNLRPVESDAPINSFDSTTETINPLKDTQEELFLLRHYSECIAPWMDLLYRYEVFSREVLTLAREHQILRYAACAVAAKQLGQMKDPMSGILRGKTQERIAAKLAQGPFGLMWYGAKYYELAIQTLMKSITPRDSAQNHASPELSLSQGNLMVRADGEDPIVRLLGTCILIQYEQLSANRDAWSGHLTGFWRLIELVDDGNLLRPNPIFEEVYPFTKDVMQVKASFWNFVVNDLEESFVSHRRTRIDTENIYLWRNVGLNIEDDGSLTTNSSPNSLSATPEHARDKILAHSLIRLLCKLVDYLAPLSEWDSILAQPEPSLVGHGKEVFESLENQFDIWFRMLSPSFHADGTFVTGQCDQDTSSGLFSREIWFSNDLCSVTMMFYHMARMLLLIHRPSDLLPGVSSGQRGNSFDLLRVFRDIEQKLQFHASEVISIVRGTPCDAVKLRAIQPLFVAGRCCTNLTDRRLLVQMLTEIEDNLGIVTGYRIESLLQEWELTREALGVDARFGVA